jgi:hypothetical protein
MVLEGKSLDTSPSYTTHQSHTTPYVPIACNFNRYIIHPPRPNNSSSINLAIRYPCTCCLSRQRSWTAGILHSHLPCSPKNRLRESAERCTGNHELGDRQVLVGRIHSHMSRCRLFRCWSMGNYYIYLCKCPLCILQLMGHNGNLDPIRTHSSIQYTITPAHNSITHMQPDT